MNFTRRHFLKTSTVAGLTWAAAPAILGAEPPGKKYTTALIGTGWWGMNILGEAMASGACKVVGLCDVDERHLHPAAEKVSQKTGDQPKKYKDFRELLAREKPEIVIVGSPDHWHPLMTIEAVKSGAHVYVEKPVGHTVREGRAMVKAARETGKVVQVGTHRRISPHNVSGRQFILAGKLGKIGFIRAFVHYGGGLEKPRKNTEPPKELDWDLWCGPAPVRPFCSGIHPKGFRNYLVYANGMLGDWGVHWMDQILWIMGPVTGEKWPRRIYSTGGRPIKGKPVFTAEEQTSDAPDSQSATFEFENFTAVWEHRQFAGNNAEKGENVGCYFYGTEGTLHIGWKNGWVFYPADSRKEPERQAPKLNQPDDQNIKELWADFLDAIKTGRKPVSDIEEVHRSTNLSLLAMLSLKIGRSIHWDGEKEMCVGDPAANQWLSREYRQGWVYPT
jgi:predicted dehydrogenase